MRGVLLSIALVLWCCHQVAPAPTVSTEQKEQETKLRRQRSWQSVSSGMDKSRDWLQRSFHPSSIIKGNHPTEMKLLVSGLGRMGTTSLAAALQILGYNVIHDDERFALLDLYAAYYGGQINVQQLHEGFGQRGFNCSFMYLPFAYEWAAEQQQQQDNVKVILNNRNPETWVDSWLSVVDIYDLIASRPFCWVPTLRSFLPLLYDIVKVHPTDGNPEHFKDRETLLRGYQVHFDRVRATVPKEQLLEYQVQEGWGPLCEFLQVPIPDQPFPHGNDRLKMAASLAVFRVLTWTWPLFLFIPVWLVFRLYKTHKLGNPGATLTKKKDS